MEKGNDIPVRDIHRMAAIILPRQQNIAAIALIPKEKEMDVYLIKAVDNSNWDIFHTVKIDILNISV